MTTHTIDSPAAPPTHRRLRAARIAGAAYVAMFALAIFANFFVVESLIVDGDAEATVDNIAGSLGMFRWGVVAFLAIFLLDVVIAWALHLVFRDVDRDRSLATAWFRLVYSVFLGVGTVFLFEASERVTASPGAGVDAAATMAAVETFERIWMIGLVAFGVHLALLGSLVVRSGIAPKALGVVVAAAGAAYAVDTLAHVLMPNYAEVAGILLATVAALSMIGEGWLGLWLLTTRRLPTHRHTVAT